MHWAPLGPDDRRLCPDHQKYVVAVHVYGSYDAAAMDMDSLDQLRKTYAEMTEDELAAIAADAYDLTDAAKGVLRKEISRRGLNIELQTAPIQPDDEAEKDEPEELQPEGEEDVGELLVHCPKCHSEKVTPVYRCDDCGHEWEDEPEAQEPEPGESQPSAAQK